MTSATKSTEHIDPKASLLAGPSDPSSSVGGHERQCWSLSGHGDREDKEVAMESVVLAFGAEARPPDPGPAQAFLCFYLEAVWLTIGFLLFYIISVYSEVENWAASYLRAP